MPCSDSRNTYSYGVEETTAKFIEKVESLEAGLCAIISELERREIANDVISAASRSGLIDLMGFWAHHSESDEARIAKILHNYSKDEQAVMKKLLDK